MKLRRAVPLKNGKGRDTAGRWRSADSAWFFGRDPQGWVIQRGTLHGSFEEHSARKRFLAQMGLSEAHFPTRRAAVAALDLALAHGSPDC